MFHYKTSLVFQAKVILEFPNKKLSGSIIICSVCLIVRRYSPFISSTVSSRLNCSYVGAYSRHCLFRLSISLLSSVIIFLIRNSINLPLDSILLISPFLQQRLKIESLELFVVLHRELSYLEIKNTEVFIPFSAYRIIKLPCTLMSLWLFRIPRALKALMIIAYPYPI